MSGVIDFDKMFEDYATEWFKEHEDDFENEEDVEAAMPDVYETWASSPSGKLGGIAPRAFFDAIENPDELVKILAGTSEDDCNPCSLLLDKIAETPSCAPLLAALIEGESKPKLKLLCVTLLEEAGAKHPLNKYLEILADETADDDLREGVIEVLESHTEEVKERLYEMLVGASDSLKTIIAEILVSGEKDERTFKLLTELFASGENVPLYAQYLGAYGDERAAAQLYRALDSCDYAEYIEIKNAIERLGGIVDDYRDFSSDPTYIAIKGRKD